jgi:hypothetical protein
MPARVDVSEFLPPLPPPTTPPEPVAPAPNLSELRATATAPAPAPARRGPDSVSTRAVAVTRPTPPPAGPPPQQPAPPPLWTGPEALAALFAGVATRDAIPDIVFGCLAQRVARVALFTVNRGVAVGWDARGDKLRREAVETIALPLDRPSIFKRAADGARYLGELPLEDVEETFVVKMGGVFPQGSVVLWPVRVKDRVIALLYAELLPGEAVSALSEPVKQLVDQMEQTFLRLILEKKKS